MLADPDMADYSAAVAEYFTHPVHAGGQQISGAAGSLEQGAWISLSADLRAGHLCNMGFRVFACPHIIAACNWLLESLDGKPCEALREVRPEELQLKFDIPVEKAGKLLILQDALHSCYADYAAYSEARGAS